MGSLNFLDGVVGSGGSVTTLMRRDIDCLAAGDDAVPRKVWYNHSVLQKHFFSVSGILKCLQFAQLT